MVVASQGKCFDLVLFCLGFLFIRILAGLCIWKRFGVGGTLKNLKQNLKGRGKSLKSKVRPEME